MASLGYIAQLMTVDYYGEAFADNQTDNNWKKTIKGHIKNTYLVQKKLKVKWIELEYIFESVLIIHAIQSFFCFPCSSSL